MSSQVTEKHSQPPTMLANRGEANVWMDHDQGIVVGKFANGMISMTPHEFLNEYVPAIVAAAKKIAEPKAPTGRLLNFRAP